MSDETKAADKQEKPTVHYVPWGSTFEPIPEEVAYHKEMNALRLQSARTEPVIQNERLAAMKRDTENAIECRTAQISGKGYWLRNFIAAALQSGKSGSDAFEAAVIAMDALNRTGR
jgi:hypothetical protein